MQHPTESEIIGFAGGGRTDDRTVDHLKACADCRRTAEDWKLFIDLLRLPGVWRANDIPAPARTQAELVAEIERMPSDEYTQLASLPFSIELVRATLEVAHDRLRRSPREALKLTEALTNVVASADVELSEVAGDIAKERANALRRLTRYAEALEALDEAEEEYRKLPAPFVEIAFVEQGRATVFFALKRFGEARQKAAAARTTFLEFGETVNAAEVRLLEGGITFDEGDTEGARSLFDEARVEFEKHGETPALALAYQNLCTCDLRLGAAKDARDFHTRAIPLLRRFGMEAEAVRLSWSVWEALAAKGDRETALPYIREAAAAFSALGMDGDAAEVGLDILEQLVALERYEEAIPLARDIATICQRTGVTPDVANALAYLEEAVRATHATAEFVKRTKTFVEARLRGASVSMDVESAS